MGERVSNVSMGNQRCMDTYSSRYGNSNALSSSLLNSAPIVNLLALHLD